jgi:hypothetical protein
MIRVLTRASELTGRVQHGAQSLGDSAPHSAASSWFGGLCSLPPPLQGREDDPQAVRTALEGSQHGFPVGEQIAVKTADRLGPASQALLSPSNLRVANAVWDFLLLGGKELSSSSTSSVNLPSHDFRKLNLPVSGIADPLNSTQQRRAYG